MIKQIRTILLYSLVLIPLSGYSFDKCERSLSTRKKQFRSFEQAQVYVQKRNIKTGTEYYELYKNRELPDDMPSKPDKTYKNKGWKGWNDFLGRVNFSRKVKDFKSFEKAQVYVQQHNIKLQRQYVKLRQNRELPDDMPSNPDKTYKNKGWISWPHFLGTIGQKRKSVKKFRNFEKAQVYVQQHNIKLRRQYIKLRQNRELPDDMPSNPDKTYKNKGWVNWNHFLGTKPSIYHNRQFRSFEKAQEYVKQRQIMSSRQYIKLSQNRELPDDMPSNPDQTYKNKGWVNWNHFLGTKPSIYHNRQFRSFEKAQEYVKQRQIMSSRQYIKLSQNRELPDDMPSNPDQTYKNKGWKGWPHFLGTLKMLTFRKAQNYALNKAGIKTVEELIEWLKSEDRPLSFPEEPHLFYEEWTNTRDFLTIHDSNKMTYAKSKEYIQSLQFKNKREAMQWLTSDERPEEMPIDPNIFYGKEWEGWDVYLGLNQGVLYDIQKEQINGTDILGSDESHHDSNEERLMEELLEAVGL